MDEEPVVYNISLTEYVIQVEGMEEGQALEFVVGQPYELHFSNDGTLEHEILVGQEALVTDTEMNYHLDFERNLLNDVETFIKGEMNGEDFAIGVSGLIEFEINPGQELTIGFTLPEEKLGEWEFACFVSSSPDATEEEPGLTHFDLGMMLPVMVLAASGD
jgi:uncharacterized cupredoxin-like copper-binding protein